MIWIFVHFALNFLAVPGMQLFVPTAHLQAYSRCEKPRDYYYALALSSAVVALGIIETILDPKPVSAVWRIYGALLYLGGHALSVWARRVNPFFIPAIRRPAFIVTVGPYRYCRHSGYLGCAIASFGTVVLLGSLWAYVPMFFYWVLLLNRAEKENELLHEVR